MGQDATHDGVYEIEACNQCKNRFLKIQDSFLGSSDLPSVTVHCLKCGTKGPMYIRRPQEGELDAVNKAITLWNNKKRLLSE